MAGQEKDLDANEPATPFKLDKAHERGSIFRSAEVNFAVVMVACVACVYGLGTRTLEAVAIIVRHALALSQRVDMTPATAIVFLTGEASRALLALAPIIGVFWVAVTLSGVVQARGVFSAEPLTPDFTRLNPAKGLTRLVNLRSVTELLRSVAKIAGVGILMTLWMRQEMAQILELSHNSVRQAMSHAVNLVGSALTLLTALVIAFAFMEWSLNRRQYMKEMRMSKRELKDERKQREGDPRIRARLRELRLEWMKRSRQISNVRGSDVLLTNPTHYAVALVYRQGEMPAPAITARGAGELAHRMRLQARRSNVPVVENAPLARALFALDESQSLVPEKHFEEVARVLRWVFAARSARAMKATP